MESEQRKIQFPSRMKNKCLIALMCVRYVKVTSSFCLQFLTLLNELAKRKSQLVTISSEKEEETFLLRQMKKKLCRSSRSRFSMKRKFSMEKPPYNLISLENFIMQQIMLKCWGKFSHSHGIECAKSLRQICVTCVKERKYSTNYDWWKSF